MKNDVLALMRADAAKPPPQDKLDALKSAVSTLRDVEFERASLTERSNELGKQIYELKTKTIVDLFDEAGVSSIGIEPKGNLPAYEIEVKPHYKANLGDLEPDEFSKAIAWLEKAGHGDMIKTTLTISFGMGRPQEALRKKLTTFLDKTKIPYSSSFGVPWNTLTAFVKGQLEARKSVPLKTLGAKVERTASLVTPKKSASKDTAAKPAKVKTPLKGKR